MSTNFKKPFDPDLYMKNDAKAKEATKKLFSKMEGTKNQYLIENFQNQFAADLYIIESTDAETFQIKGTVETEIKSSFKGTTYNYPNIRISARKLKLAGSHFVVLNADCSAGWWIPADVIEKSPIIEVTNRMSEGKPEAFISVDPDKAQLIIIKEKKHKKQDTDPGEGLW